jgi:hypothetical protein
MDSTSFTLHSSSTFHPSSVHTILSPVTEVLRSPGWRTGPSSPSHSLQIACETFLEALLPWSLHNWYTSYALSLRLTLTTGILLPRPFRLDANTNKPFFYNNSLLHLQFRHIVGHHLNELKKVIYDIVFVRIGPLLSEITVAFAFHG